MTSKGSGRTAFLVDECLAGHAGLECKHHPHLTTNARTNKLANRQTPTKQSASLTVSESKRPSKCGMSAVSVMLALIESGPETYIA